ncbi:MAG: HD-GYP domain-containing protein [Spirochaetaceae bacterium]
MDSLQELYRLFEKLDKAHGLNAKLQHLAEWPERVLGARAVRLVCADEASVSTCPQNVSFLPSDQLASLPARTTLINGKTPIPFRLFGEHENHEDTTVHVPVFGASSPLIGAFLVKCDSPRSFLKKNTELLSIVSSKTKDLLEHAVARSHLSRCRDRHEGESDVLAPETIARLMDLIDLPMYVAAGDGTFVAANSALLRRFRYDSTEALNAASGFFVQTESWEQQLRRLARTEHIATVEVNVRAGDGSVRVARDHSTLIGKHTFGVLIDLTEYVEVNESLERALADQRTLNEKLQTTTNTLQKTQATAMKSLAKLAEFRDKETGNHLQRICTYMQLLATELHKRQPYSFLIGPGYADDIYLSGMLHDIGKVAIPDTVLLKPGSLDSREWDMMKKHSQFGWSILHEADQELGEQSFLTLASRIALYHHERYDGTGYPHGLSGEDIPLSARIAAVADVYDALTSDRPYKSAWSHRSAIREIESERGRHFDPVLVDIVLEIQDKFLAVQTDAADQPEITN